MAETLPPNPHLDICVGASIDDLIAEYLQDSTFVTMLPDYAQLTHGEEMMSVSRIITDRMVAYMDSYDDRVEEASNLAFHFAFEMSQLAGEVKFEIALGPYMEHLKKANDPGEEMMTAADRYLRTRPNIERLINKFLDHTDPEIGHVAYIPATVAAITFMLAEYDMHITHERQSETERLERQFRQS